MADQKVNTETIKNVIANEQLSDILLVIDKKNKTVEAVKGIDKDGKPQTVPATRNNEFIKIGHNSDPLDILVTAVRNFYSQARDPTRFEILKVPQKVFSLLKGIKNMALLINELTKYERSPQADAFAEKYGLESSNSAKQEINNNQKDQAMAKNQQSAANPQTAQKPQEPTNQRFNESMIDWKTIEAFGVSREYLKDRGLLDNMLKGYKTSQLVPVSLNMGAAVVRTDARLSFQQSVGGPVVLAVHGLRQEPQLQKPYFGHIFSEEDKQNLRESGNMGRSVELKDRNNEYHPYLISIDKLTNEIVGTKADKVYIPNEVKGVTLTDQDKADLREGKKVYLEGMTSQNGKEFSAEIQINADRRGIEYIFPENQQQKTQVIGGVELSPQQGKDLSEGKAIFVEDMKRKDGELFSSFIKRDEASNSLSYTRYNPDSPEGAREIYIPKEIGGVQLTGEERDTLRKGEPIFLDGMVNRKGEEFSSYIKADTETGKLNYNSRPDGFAQVEQFKIPAEVFGVTLNVTQRAQLQDGKSVLVEGMKGFDGKEFSSYVKVNPNQAKLDYFREDPDKPRAAQQNRNNAAQSQDAAKEEKTNKSQGSKAENQDTAKEKKPRKSRGPQM